MKKYILPVIVVLILLSCSEMPTRDNPYDLYFDMPEPTDLQVENISITTKRFSWNYDLDRFDGFIISRQVNGSWTVIDTVAMDVRNITDYDIPVNVNIRYKIVAYADQNFSDEVLSDYIDNTIPTPTDLTVTQTNIHRYELIWEQSHIIGEDGFVIERQIGEGNSEQIAVLEADSEGYIDNWEIDRRGSNEVIYQIKAYIGDEYSSPAVAVNQIMLDSFSPSDLSFEKLAINRIKLEWNDNSEGEEGFRIDKKVGSGEWLEEFATTDADSTNWIDENAEINQDISYRIRAYYGEFESDIVETGAIDNAFPIPSDLTYEKLAINRIKLEWNDNSEGEEGFRIDKKVGSGEWLEEFATTDADSTNWIDESSEINQEITYRIRAYYGEFESDIVETGAIDNTFPVPANLTWGMIGENVCLSWEYDLAGIEGFRIEKKVYEGDWQPYAYNIDADLRDWTDYNSNIMDSYRIKAYYQGYESMPSNEAIFVIPDMIYVEGGTFNNGTSDVTVSSFFIGQYEVTQSEYEAVMGNNPSAFTGVTNRPVENVSWFDAIEYCNRRSMDAGITPCYSYSTYGTNPDDWPTGWNTSSGNHTNVSCDWTANGYRLPTEAEWHFAALGGNETHNYTYSGSNNIGEVAWYGSNSGSSTHTVGTKAAIELGTFDMSGNVYEWVWDIYGSYMGGAQTNPHGAVSGTGRVRRGGSWYSDAFCCAVSYRSHHYATSSGSSVGFRLCRVSP